MIRRRFFLITIATTLAGLVDRARAQSSNRPFTVGLLSFAAPSDDPAYEALRQRLRELGYIEGRSIRIEFRSAQGDSARFPAIAKEMVELNADAIVVGNPVAAKAMMNATSTIPIVIATSDPVSAGLVTNLARPGGNVTGLSTMTSELYGKRLELLKETIPGLKRVGLVWHPFSPTMEKFTERVKAIAPTLSLKVIPIKVEDAAEFESAFTGASRARIQAVYLAESPLFYARRAVLARLALKARLPSLYGTSAYVNDGGFMSYGADFTDQARRIAEYVDKILKGAKPGDLPIEQSTKVQLAINLKTAKALGLTIPQSVLARADQVVQ